MSINQAYNYRAVSDTVATAGVLKPEQLAGNGSSFSKAAIQDWDIWVTLNP